LLAGGQAKEAEALLETGLRLVAGSRSRVEVRLCIERVSIAYWTQDAPRTVHLAMEAVALARSCGFEEARALCRLAQAHQLSMSPEGLAYATAALEAARLDGQPEVECDAAWVAACMLYASSRAAEAERLAVSMAERAKSLGLRRWQMEFELCRVHDALFARAQYASSIADLRRLSREHALGPNIDQVNADLGFALADVGRTAEALTTLARALPRARTSYGRDVLILAVVEAEWLAGRAAVAAAVADEVIGRSAATPLLLEFRLARAWAGFDLSARDIEQGPPASGSNVAEAGGGELGPQATFVQASGHEIAGLANLGRPDGAAAAELAFRLAADMWSGHVLRSELRCRWGEGEAALRGGDVARARRLLLDAEQRCQDVGFVGLLGRIRGSLRRSGLRRSGASARTISGLSVREQEILALVGEGLHTSDIVRRLGLSRSTVDGLVVSAREEMNARTRVQAASHETKDDGGGPPLIIVEHASERRTWMERILTTTGWTIRRGWDPGPALTAERVIHVGRIAGADDAAAALLAAGRGAGILALTDGRWRHVDRFAEDLGRFGSVRVVDADRDEDRASALDEEQWRLLALLGAGSSVTHAARALHMSRRTAERRLAAARVTLRVRTTAAAVSFLRQEQSLLGVTSVAQ
jgi:DNA-binding NarL/FixJ family response regulator